MIILLILLSSVACAQDYSIYDFNFGDPLSQYTIEVKDNSLKLFENNLGVKEINPIFEVQDNYIYYYNDFGTIDYTRTKIIRREFDYINFNTEIQWQD